MLAFGHVPPSGGLRIVEIAAVRCVEYTGTLDHPGAFWEERLVRPVDVYPRFRAEGPEFLALSSAGAYRLTSVFVHIETDDGVTGTAGPITREQAHLIQTGFAPLLRSQDPLATEHLWDVMYRHAVHGRKGVEMMAISALDCALWDLKGRHFGVPVHVLLGGPVREAIPAYASALGYSLDLDRVRERAAEIVAAGFTATKWFPRHGPADGRAGIAANTALVGALREAVGPDVDLMVDAWMSWDVPYALQMADRLAEFAPRWIEEPVLPDKPQSYAEITRRMRTGILVAGAEHEYTRWGIHQLMAAGALHVYQPDTYWAGGISEMLKIAALASAYDVQLIPHGHSVPANAHFSFAQPPTLTPMIEYLVKWNVIHQHFLARPVHPVDGVVTPPTAPGLGMDLDDDKIESSRELRFA
jgi:L-alanine-DL-glutamate epimerase-like enolase superfamily enzyme